MAIVIEYTVEDELTEAVEAMLAKPEYSEFKDIRDMEVIILPCFSVRTDDDAQTQPCKGPPIKLKKVSPLEKLFMKQKAHYLLVVDYHTWENAGDKQGALLHHALMHISVARGDDGEIKLGSRKPDVVEFSATARRYGAYTDTLLDLRESFRLNSARLLPRPARRPAATEPEPEPEPE